MSVEHVLAGTAPEKVFEILQRDGCVVIDDLIGPDIMAAAPIALVPRAMVLSSITVWPG